MMTSISNLKIIQLFHTTFTNQFECSSNEFEYGLKEFEYECVQRPFATSGLNLVVRFSVKTRQNHIWTFIAFLNHTPSLLNHALFFLSFKVILTTWFDIGFSTNQ